MQPTSIVSQVCSHSCTAHVQVFAGQVTLQPIPKLIPLGCIRCHVFSLYQIYNALKHLCCLLFCINKPMLPTNSTWQAYTALIPAHYSITNSILPVLNQQNQQYNAYCINTNSAVKGLAYTNQQNRQYCDIGILSQCKLSNIIRIGILDLQINMLSSIICIIGIGTLHIQPTNQWYHGK